MKMYREAKANLHTLLTSLDGSEYLVSQISHLTSMDRVSGTHWRGGWVGGPQSFSEHSGEEKNPCPCWKSNPNHSVHNHSL